MARPAAGAQRWWENAVIYQIYPRSFADGNGDGIGDLPGIIDRLDYLQDLGIDAVWLSPHYVSPQVDIGYDVADYTAVAPEYGTLADFDRFLTGAHERGIRVVLDWVVNHTSDRHAWFDASRRSRHDPRRDWYVWHPGRDGGPPNNWFSAFGGPAWTQDPATGEWYYHFFFPEQPDLNWHNPDVRTAMFDTVRFWLDRGVDGFRLDAIGTVFEDPDLTDHASPFSQEELMRRRFEASTEAERHLVDDAFAELYARQVEHPGVHEVFRALRSVVDEYGGKLLLGETDHADYHGDNDELHLVFNFPLGDTELLTPQWIRSNQEQRRRALPPGAWPCNTLGNHDRPRMWSRYGDGVNDAALARLNAALVLTLRGTPVLYNGEEIGMTDLRLTDPAQFRDMLSPWMYRVLHHDLGLDHATAMHHAVEGGRDKGRTPMQWANKANGGFCPAGVTPWLPVNPDFADGINVADQTDDPASTLSFYRRLLRVRRDRPSLQVGETADLLPDSDEVLATVRRHESEATLVLLNYASRNVDVGAPLTHGEVLLSSHRSAGRRVANDLRLAPHEVLIASVC